MKEKIICPECGNECTYDEVDVGVGNIQSPPYCLYCGWEEQPSCERFDLEKLRPRGK